MLFLLSPAKALDYETPAHVSAHTLPLFGKQTKELMAVLKTQSPQQVSELMDLSPALANLNVARYQAWSSKPTARHCKQAVLAFNGDVYEGLDAKTLDEASLQWAQERVCMLSGLYGVLRPLDRMQPYRLEMGAALAGPWGKNLYQFWGAQITEYLNQRSLPLVNLASQEYFKVIDQKTLRVPVLSCVFEDYKAGRYKVISFLAKRARGLMLRYAIDQRVRSTKRLQGFTTEGYKFDPEASQPQRWVFRRRVL